MKDGIASHTARTVAARRLGFERVPENYGDPAADLALACDVAAGLVPAQSRMGEYIRARTAFFDRVVVAALKAGMSQVVVGAAGYDGRSLRYAKPGVRWFEVDHPATQGDKLERLARLGIDAGHVRFVAADFTKDPVASQLLEAGLAARRPALFLFEGIAVYLEDSVTESVLAQFRQVTVAGSLLAISVSVTSGAGSRSAFRARVAAMGEPARSVLDPEEAEAMLARAGWQVTGGRAACQELVVGIEDAWLDRFGAGTVAGLQAGLERLPVRDLLAGTEPYPEGWRAQVRPPDVLPHYPMVAHRGGSPDGS